MKQTLLLLASLATALFAVPTSTDTTFESETPAGTDKYGNALYERSVTIKTNDFKVENFWDKFHESGEAQSNYTNISKTGTVRISAEGTSICKLYPGLDAQGCSGQKPFLINDEALNGVGVGDTITLLFQKDYDLSTDTILYSETNGSVFYPLDIERTEKYYKDTGARTFNSYFSSMFNTFFGEGTFFGSFFSFDVVDNDSADAEDIRQRYIANIVSGVDQAHRMEKGITPLATTTLNTPVSLIDYEEDTSSAGSCNFLFFKFPEASPFCNLMSAMPFISMFTSTTPATNYTIDTIQTDTENSLVSFAGTYADITLTEYQAGTVYEKQSESTGLVTGMMDMMKCFFFGCSEADEVNEPMDSYYAFTDESAVSLNFAVTNSGTQIDDFQNFKLMGIHSLSGNQQSCRVKENGWGDSWTEHTFKAGEEGSYETTTTENVCTNWFFMMCTAWEEVTTTTTVDNTYSANDMSETVQSNLMIDEDGDDRLTPAEWLTWCDYMADTYSAEATTETVCLFFICHEETVLPSLEEDGYEVLDYTNATKRGLLLDLKLTDLRTDDKANTLRYQLINTTN